MNDYYKIGRIRLALLRICARVLLLKWQRKFIAGALKAEAFQSQMASWNEDPIGDLLDRIASAFDKDDDA